MMRPQSPRHRACEYVQATSAGVALAWLVLVAGSGCASPKWDVADFLQSHEYAAAGSDFKVMPGDWITFASPHVLEIDGVTEQVDIDGTVNLDLIDAVHVAGLTAKQIKRKVESQLQPYYREPRLRVRVSGQESKKIYVFGQVSGAGPRPFTGRDTVFDLLMECRPTFLAWKSQVKVVRASPHPDQRREIKVDFDKMAKQGDLRLNVLLQEGDIVYVPPTPLAWIGLRIQEVLFPVAPAFQAYTAPAQAMWATDEYQGENDDDDGDGGGRLRRINRLRR